ncbi:MAG: ABC transporter permease [Verrucomicrobiota bacterium]
MSKTTIIQPPKRFISLVSWSELWAYRDLLMFLTWRDIKARYAQSVLGIGWAVIQPLFQMLVFTLVLGKMAGIPSDGAPYAIFAFVGLLPWTFFANALTGSSGSLIANAGMLNKIYFPRLVMPLSATIAKMMDFVIASLILIFLLIFYQKLPSIYVLYAPLLILILFMTAVGIGCFLTALAIQYRDIQYAMGFGVQLAMYASPVVYSSTLVPLEWRGLYAMNPMVGVIEGFRSIFLNTIEFPLTWVLQGFVVSVILFICGILFFASRERVFADVA